MKTRILKQATFRGIIPFVIMSALALIMTYQKIDPLQVRGTFLTGIIISIVAAAIDNFSLFINKRLVRVKLVR